MKLRILGFLVWSAMCVWSCQSVFLPTMRLPTATLQARDYQAVLSLWTQSDALYRGFEHKLSVRSTLIVPMLRRVFQLRFPEIYGYGSTVTRKELVELNDASEETLNFFVAAYTTDDKWNDFEKPDSIWHLSLERKNAGQETGIQATVKVDAIQIERIKIDQNLRDVYPYLGGFDQAYLVRFPLVNTQGQPILLQSGKMLLKLRIASSMGAAEMSWPVIL